MPPSDTSSGAMTSLNTSPSLLCLPISLVPRLTIYSQAVVSFLPNLPQKQKWAVFLPLLIEVSLASTLVATGSGTGALIHSVDSSRDLPERLQVAIEASAESPASHQRQMTSVAQVAFQNRRAWDPLTAARAEPACFSTKEAVTMSMKQVQLRPISAPSPESVSLSRPGTTRRPSYTSMVAAPTNHTAPLPPSPLRIIGILVTVAP